MGKRRLHLITFRLRKKFRVPHSAPFDTQGEVSTLLLLGGGWKFSSLGDLAEKDRGFPDGLHGYC